MARARGETSQLTESLQNVGVLLAYLHRFGEAVTTLREAHALATRLGDEKLAAQIMVSVGACLWEAGEAEESVKVQGETLVLLKRVAGENVALAIGHVNLADSLRSLGRVEEALASVRTGQAMLGRLCHPDDPNVPWAGLILANCLMIAGRPADALPVLQEVRKTRERILPAGHTDIGIVYENLGECHFNLGRPAEALPYREKGLEIHRAFSKGGPSPDVARAEDNLGQCLGTLGRHAEALEHSTAALEMYKSLYGEKPNISVSITLENIAAALKFLGRVEEATARLEEKLAMARKLPGRWHEAAARSYLAQILHERGKYAQALAHAREALSILEGGPRAHALHSLVGLILLDGLREADDAVPHFEAAIAQVATIRAQAGTLRGAELAAFFESLRIRDPFAGMVRAQVALGHPDEAVRYLERGRARGLLDLLARSRVDPLAEAERAAGGDAAALERIRRVKEAIARTERDVGRLTFLIGRAGRDETKRKTLEPELRAARQAHAQARRDRARLVQNVLPLAEPSDPAEIQAMLAENERMLIYEVGDSSSLLLVVPPTGQGIRSFRLPTTRRELAGLVNEYRDTLGRGELTARGIVFKKQPTRGDVTAMGEKLFKKLVPTALWKELQGLERIYIVPHGPLHLIPFEALIVKPGADAATHTYWLDAGPAVAYGSSASALVHGRQRREAQKGAKPRYAAVALGDPYFGKGLPKLNGTRKEVLALQKALDGDVAVLLGEDASETRLTELAPQARYLHLATHHLVDETDYASYSRLALTLPEKATQEDDGFLTLVDVLDHWRGRLAGCELAVLSACSTQQGALQKDEGVHAMPLGFLYAGCPSVIASLWGARDQPTAELMSAFYKQLAAQGGRNKLAAFTSARKALRKSYPEPHHWAPFIYIGYPR